MQSTLNQIHVVHKDTGKLNIAQARHTRIQCGPALLTWCLFQVVPDS